MQKSAIVNYIENQLHPAVVKKYANAKKAATDSYKAKRLENYFNRIVVAANMQRAGFSKWATDSFVQELMSLPYGVNSLSSLFNYSLTPNPNVFSEEGFQFEKDLQLIINKAFQTSINEGVGQKKIVGKSQFLGEDLQNISVRALDYMSNELNTWVKYKYGQLVPKKAGELYRLAEVYGKVDLKAPSSVQLSIARSRELEEFIYLLQDANISAKNYTNVSNVSLGGSNYFRVVSSVLEDLGSLHSQNILWVYHSTLNPRRSKVLASHKYHLRFVYELMGPGQYYDINGSLQSLGTVDFLIVFNKSTNQIFVRSAKALVNKILNSLDGNKKSISVNLLTN